MVRLVGGYVSGMYERRVGGSAVFYVFNSVGSKDGVG